MNNTQWKITLYIVGAIFIIGGLNRMINGPREVDAHITRIAKPQKQVRKSLKGGYFACTTESRFDEIITAAMNKDTLQVGTLLSNGCVMTKGGVRASVVDLGIGTTKIRAYNGTDSILLYTNTENIRY